MWQAYTPPNRRPAERLQFPQREAPILQGRRQRDVADIGDAASLDEAELDGREVGVSTADAKRQCRLS